MRILFVLGGLRVGGYEILSVRIAEALASRGNHVGILSLSVDSQIAGRLHPNIEINVVRRYFKYDLSFLLRVSKALCHFKPDIVVCCAFYPYFIIKSASLIYFRQMRSILAFHVTEPYDNREDKWNNIYTKCARFFRDYYIAIHSTQVDFYEKRYRLPRSRFTIIHNGVDTDRFSGEHCGRTDVVFRIAHIASLKPLKDQWSLLKAMVEFNRHSKRWELVIAGADDFGLQREYEDFVFKHGLTRKITFLGLVSDTHDLLCRSDVFVLTSVTEALPMSVLEAISMGLPCIVTDVGGNSDIIEHGKEGFLVQPRDYRAIASYLEFLITHPSKRRAMSLAARKKAIDKFGFGQMTEQYINLFKKVLAR